MTDYKVGDHDTRPWGSYRVTAVGDGFCEKEIIVKPHQILSLQSHDHRKEKWTVTTGRLTALVDNSVHALNSGQSVDIPLGAMHCMANATDSDVIVHERQEGNCSESDIHRYADAYGRGTAPVITPEQQKSLVVYQGLLKSIVP
jgi:mannose-6-phosphate isomerase-like protein (cupin superfamily)